jgi:hypothetical protein
VSLEEVQAARPRRHLGAVPRADADDNGDPGRRNSRHSPRASEHRQRGRFAKIEPPHWLSPGPPSPDPSKSRPAETPSASSRPLKTISSGLQHASPEWQPKPAYADTHPSTLHAVGSSLRYTALSGSTTRGDGDHWDLAASSRRSRTAWMLASEIGTSVCSGIPRVAMALCSNV